jgi:hypothetical protein
MTSAGSNAAPTLGRSGPRRLLRGTPPVLAWLLVVGLLVDAACTSGADRSPANPATPSSGPSAGPCASPETVDESANQTAVGLCVGQVLTVVLNNTHWEQLASSDQSVLRADAASTIHVASPEACVPGAGCGTITRMFVAIAPGSVIVSAHRTSCGEALQCASGQGSFTVSVTVG